MKHGLLVLLKYCSHVANKSTGRSRCGWRITSIGGAWFSSSFQPQLCHSQPMVWFSSLNGSWASKSSSYSKEEGREAREATDKKLPPPPPLPPSPGSVTWGLRSLWVGMLPLVVSLATRSLWKLRTLLPTLQETKGGEASSASALKRNNLESQRMKLTEKSAQTHGAQFFTFQHPALCSVSRLPHLDIAFSDSVCHMYRWS